MIFMLLILDVAPCLFHLFQITHQGIRDYLLVPYSASAEVKIIELHVQVLLLNQYMYLIV